MSIFNLLLENLDPLSQLLLQALFKTLWQGLLITALVWLLLRLFKQASATTRHAVWLASLLMIAALPLIAIATRRDAQLPNATASNVQPQRIGSRPIALPQVTTPVPPVTALMTNLIEPRTVQSSVRTARPFGDYDRAAQVDQTSHLITLAESAKVARPTTIQAPPTIIKKSFRQRASDWFANSQWPLAQWPLVMITVWLMVCAVMMARILHSYYSLRVLRRSLNAAAGEQQDRTQYLADLFGIRRQVRLFTTAQVAMPRLIPMTIGAFKPIIALPSDLASALSQSEFDSVVAHELAHIKRWDYLTNLLQRLAQAALFFHPAVWFIGRQLMIERELACDDWAVKMCEPRRYASCLARLVEILSDSRPLAAAAGILFGKHVISRRVEMVLNRDRNATTAVSKPAVAYAIGLAVMLVAVCSLMSPVVAIPLGQQARKQKKEVKATIAVPSTGAGALTPLSPIAPDALPELFELADSLDAPLPPLPPLPPDAPEMQIASADLLLSMQDPPPPPAAPPAPASAPSAPFAPPAPPAMATTVYGLTGSFAATAPVAAIGSADSLYSVAVAGFGQDDKNRTPAIPEAEMLSLLTDIVKRDTDPNVRNEALQGIYRLRSDAAINTLIQLYDSVSDPKTKGEIIAYMLRRTGDNSKATAKLTQIAKSEKDEELRNRAIRYLGNVKGDEGATTLIQIYDTLQDPKTKQYVVRSLAFNKSPKAIEKLKQIAKSDSDPQIRSAAIRSLYSVDNRLYMDTLPPGAKIGRLDQEFNFNDNFNFDNQRAFEFDAKHWAEMQQEWQEKWKENQGKYKELMEKMQIKGLDELRIEMPKIEMKLKEIEQQIKEGQNVNQTAPLRNQLRVQIAQVSAKLATLRSQYTENHPTLIETRKLLNSLQAQLDRAETTRVRTPKAAASPEYRVAPTVATPQPRPGQSKGTGASASSMF